jgi:DNA-binding MarR family transcriptional regulator
MAAFLASSLLQSASHLLHRAGQRADSIFATHVGEAVTPRQFAVLQAVAEAEGLSQTDIMKKTGIDRSGTADLVRRLISHGWLLRRRSNRDARIYAVRLTPEGRQALALGARAARATEEILLSSLSHAQRANFLEALAGIAQLPKDSKLDVFASAWGEADLPD